MVRTIAGQQISISAPVRLSVTTSLDVFRDLGSFILSKSRWSRERPEITRYRNDVLFILIGEVS